MNAWSILLFLIAFAAPAMAFVESIEVKKKCLEEVGVSEEEVRNRNSNPNPSPMLKCYINCFLESINVIKDNSIIPGGFRNIFESLITEEAIERVESRCHTKEMPADSLKDKCDFGFMLSRCYDDILTTSDLKKKPEPEAI